jgi:2-methylcitrate dehydratase PrpD
MAIADTQAAGLTRELIADVRDLTTSALPSEVVAVARHCLVDWVGGAIGGSHEPLVLKLIDEAREQGGHPACTIVGHGERTSAMFAAMVNASAADALDFSDTNLAMRGHTTPAVVATALALAETGNASGDDLLKAIVAGIEMECRVGLLVNRPMLRKGFHPTGNLATFGATAAAARLLNLDPGRWAHALGLAATQAAGLLASGGTMSKPLHSGRAAMSGMLAAKLAGRDFIARPDAIEAPDGFLETHATNRDDHAVASVRGHYLILNTVFKAHAACQLTHGSIENMFKFTRDHRVTPDNVRRIELQVSPVCLTVCNIQEPVTGLEAKFSLRTVAAMALLGDNTREISTYTAERAVDPEVQQLRERIVVTPRNDLSGGVSVAIAKLTNDRTLTATSDSYQPQSDPASRHAIVTRKFMSLVVPALGDANAQELLRRLLAIDELPSVKPVVEMLAKEPYQA